MSLATIPEAVAALRAGRPIIVADDEGRENEGDVILAAESASQEWVAWMVKNSSGFICAPMTNEIADALNLPPMVSMNEDPRGTAYTVSVVKGQGGEEAPAATAFLQTMRAPAGRQVMARYGFSMESK